MYSNTLASLLQAFASFASIDWICVLVVDYNAARVLNSRRAMVEIPCDSVKSIRSVMFFELLFERYYQF